MANIIIILQLIPALIAAIKAIEEAMPGQGQGEQKLAMLRGILEAIDAGAKDLWPRLHPIISMIVTTFNATGTFKR